MERGQRDAQDRTAELKRRSWDSRGLVEARSKTEAGSSVVARVPGRCGLQAGTRTVQWRGGRKVCPTSPNAPWFLVRKEADWRAEGRNCAEGDGQVQAGRSWPGGTRLCPRPALTGLGIGLQGGLQQLHNCSFQGGVGSPANRTTRRSRAAGVGLV